MNERKLIGLILGPALFLLSFLIQTDAVSSEALIVLGTVGWMLTWWMLEVVPLAFTALLPIILFPLTGFMSMKEVTTPYGSKFVFLFLGGFVLALALEKWNVHKRMALSIVKRTGQGANRIVLGFMLASAFLSMWISNTATTLMMLPIALSIIHFLKEGPKESQKKFALLLLLGVAYAANIGGFSTLVGTPPNGAMADVLNEQFKIDVGFSDWMLMALPVSLIMLFSTYFILTKILFRHGIKSFSKGSDVIKSELVKLGKIRDQELRVLIIFIATGLAWIFRKWLQGVPGLSGLNDTIISLMAMGILFLIPAKRGDKEALLTWKDTQKLPWGILLLFGGGLCLAAGFKKSGLDVSIVSALSEFDQLGIGTIVLIVILISIFLTELMSNLALVAMIAPVLGTLALSMGLNVMFLIVPATIAASCAFMLPVSTPPNAIVFASGHIKIKDMAKAGIVLNIAAVLILWVLQKFYMIPLIENF